MRSISVGSSAGAFELLTRFDTGQRYSMSSGAGLNSPMPAAPLSHGQRLLELARLCPQRLHLVGGGLTCRVAGQPPLAGLQELLRPAVIHALRDTLFAAKLGDAGFATQSFQDNADLLFGRILPPRCAAYMS